MKEKREEEEDESGVAKSHCRLRRRPCLVFTLIRSLACHSTSSSHAFMHASIRVGVVMDEGMST